MVWFNARIRRVAVGLFWGIAALGQPPSVPAGRTVINLTGEWWLKPATREELFPRSMVKAGVDFELLAPKTGGAVTELVDEMTADQPIVWAIPEPPDETQAGEIPRGWLKLTTPGVWHDHNQSAGAWLVKDVDVGPVVEGRAFLLKLESAVFGCRVFVNGEEVGQRTRGGVSPITMDITRAIRPGRNRLTLALNTLSTEILEHPGWALFKYCLIEHSAGIQGPKGEYVGLWHRATLEITSKVYIESILAKPSVRDGMLRADVEIVNAGEDAATLRVWAEVQGRGADATNAWPTGERLLTLEARQVTLAPGERRIVEVAAPWPEPRLWWPHDPYLYTLHGHVENRADGSKDTVWESFGFREITIEGNQLKLNGHRLILRGGSYSRGMTVFRNKAEARKVIDGFSWTQGNSMRTHPDPVDALFLEAADEAGLMLLIQGPLAASGKGTGDPEGWEIYRDMFLRYVKHNRNHPSVIIWSTDNEANGMSPYYLAPSIPFLVDILKATKALDPTRPVTSSHGYELTGVSDFMDTPTGGLFDSLYDLTGPRNYRRLLSHYGILHLRKPIINDEWCEGHSVNTAAALLGDRAYIHTDARDGDVRSWPARWAQANDVYQGALEQRRWPFIAVMMPFGDRFSYLPYDPITGQTGDWSWDPAVRDYAQNGLKPALVTPVEWNGGAWAGEPYERPMIIMNDNFFPLSGHLKWAVQDGEGTTLVHGQVPFALPAATRTNVTIRFFMPSAQKPVEWTLALALQTSEGEVVYEDQHRLGVIPRPDLALHPPVAVWPGIGNLASLAQAPFRYASVSELPSDDRIVLVPHGVLLSSHQWNALERWIEAGGRALILNRVIPPPQFLGARTVLARQQIVIAHVATPDHPVVQDLPAPALRYWLGAAGSFYDPCLDIATNASFDYSRSYDQIMREGVPNTPDFVIAQNILVRPNRGAALTILEAAGKREPHGLMLAPLVEIRSGRGRALWCTLLLIEALETWPTGSSLGEPGAWFLLDRSLAYLRDKSQWVGGEPKPVRWVGGDPRRYGVLETDRFSEAGALVVMADTPEGAEYLAESREWLNYAQNGGTVLLHNLSAEQVSALSTTLGVSLKSTSFDRTRALLGEKPIAPRRLDWVATDPLIRGIGHFHVNFTVTESLCVRWASQATLLTGVRGEPPAVNLTRESALTIVPVGQGRVVIDQVLWNPTPETPRVRRVHWDRPLVPLTQNDHIFAHEEIEERAYAYVGQLLANIGTAFVTRRWNVAPDAPQPSEDTLALYHFEDDPEWDYETEYQVPDKTTAGSAPSADMAQAMGEKPGAQQQKDLLDELVADLAEKGKPSEPPYTVRKVPFLTDHGGSDFWLRSRQIAFGPGRFHQALHLTSRESLAWRSRFHYAVLFAPEERTIEFWYRPPEDPSEDASGILIASWRHNGPLFDQCIAIRPDGRLHVSAGSVVLTSQMSLAGSPEWKHVVITSSVRHRRARLFVNGRLDAHIPHSLHYPHGCFSIGDPRIQVFQQINYTAPAIGTAKGFLDELHFRRGEWAPDENME